MFLSLDHFQEVMEVALILDPFSLQVRKAWIHFLLPLHSHGLLELGIVAVGLCGGKNANTLQRRLNPSSKHSSLWDHGSHAEGGVGGGGGPFNL